MATVIDALFMTLNLELLAIPQGSNRRRGQFEEAEGKPGQGRQGCREIRQGCG